MARIILGERPDIQAKAFKYTLPTDFTNRAGSGDLEELLETRARAAQVPAEATRYVSHDPVIDAMIYSWHWWEVTL